MFASDNDPTHCLPQSSCGGHIEFSGACMSSGAGPDPTRRESAGSPLELGLERLLGDRLDLLHGKRVGLITNPTGVDRNLVPITRLRTTRRVSRWFSNDSWMRPTEEDDRMRRIGGSGGDKEGRLFGSWANLRDRLLTLDGRLFGPSSPRTRAHRTPPRSASRPLPDRAGSSTAWPSAGRHASCGRSRQAQRGVAAVPPGSSW